MRNLLFVFMLSCVIAALVKYQKNKEIDYTVRLIDSTGKIEVKSVISDSTYYIDIDSLIKVIDKENI